MPHRGHMGIPREQIEPDLDVAVIVGLESVNGKEEEADVTELPVQSLDHALADAVEPALGLADAGLVVEGGPCRSDSEGEKGDARSSQN